MVEAAMRAPSDEMSSRADRERAAAAAEGEGFAAPPLPPQRAQATVGWAETVWRYGAPQGARLRWLSAQVPVLRRPSVLESLLSAHVTSWGEHGDVTAVLRSDARRHRLDAIGEASLPRLLTAYAAAGWIAAASPSFAVRHDTLSGGWSAYWDRRPAALRSRLARKERGARVVQLPPDEAIGLAGRLDARGPADAASAGFHAAVIRRGSAEGWARAYALDSGFDRPALAVWLVGGNHASLLRAWTDAAAAPREPGAVLLTRCLRALAAEGVAGFDLGRDAEDKRAWASFTARRWRVRAAALRSLGGVRLALRHPKSLRRRAR